VAPDQAPATANGQPKAHERDRQVLQLRSKGVSFAKIATEVGLDRPTDAVNAFHRALLRAPAAERVQLRQEEAARLDAWADRIGETSEGEVKERKLRSIDVLRKLVLAP
jgi:hypothetical protein